MKSPVNTLQGIVSDRELYWDYVFLLLWIFVAVLLVCAILSHIRTENDIYNEQQKQLEKDRKKRENNNGKEEKT